MISIERGPCPDVLGKKPSSGVAYRNQQVVHSLWSMQHGKCCYCEQAIPEEGHQKAVEHFRPQSIFKGRKNDWENLLLACPQCNGKKSDKFPVQLTRRVDEVKVIYLQKESESDLCLIELFDLLLIDPSDSNIDPEDHIDFIVDDRENDYGLIIARNNSSKGKTTIEAIGLSNGFYTRKHRDLLASELLPLYAQMLRAKNQKEERQLDRIKREFEMYMSAKSELSALARAFAKYKRLDENFGLPIPSSEEK